MTTLRKKSESSILEYLKDALIVINYSKEGFDFYNKKIPERIHVKAFGKGYKVIIQKHNYGNDYFGNVIGLETTEGFTENQVKIFATSEIHIFSPLNNQILVTLKSTNTIVEILVDEVIFGAYKNLEHIEFNNIIFLSPEQEKEYKDFIEIINIVNFEDVYNLTHRYLKRKRELKNRPAFRIHKIELLPTKEYFKDKLNDKTQLTKYFRQTMKFEKGDYKIEIDPDERSVTIVYFTHRNQWRRCGWDGTQEVTYEDENRAKMLFPTYYELCRTFDIPYVYKSKFTINYTFKKVREFENIQFERIEGKDYY